MTNKEKQKLQKKQKIKKTLIKIINVFCYICTGLFIITLLLSGCSKNNLDHKHNNEIDKPSYKLVTDTNFGVGNINSDDLLLRYDEGGFEYRSSTSYRNERDISLNDFFNDILSYNNYITNVNIDLLVWYNSNYPAQLRFVRCEYQNSQAIFYTAEGASYNMYYFENYNVYFRFKSDLYIPFRYFGYTNLESIGDYSYILPFNEMLVYNSYNSNYNPLNYYLSPVLEMPNSLTNFELYFLFDYPVYHTTNDGPTQYLKGELFKYNCFDFNLLSESFVGRYVIDADIFDMTQTIYNSPLTMPNGNLRFNYSLMPIQYSTSSGLDFPPNALPFFKNVICTKNVYNALNTLFHRNGDIYERSYFVKNNTFTFANNPYNYLNTPLFDSDFNNWQSVEGDAGYHLDIDINNINIVSNVSSYSNLSFDLYRLYFNSSQALGYLTLKFDNTIIWQTTFEAFKNGGPYDTAIDLTPNTEYANENNIELIDYRSIFDGVRFGYSFNANYTDTLGYYVANSNVPSVAFSYIYQLMFSSYNLDIILGDTQTNIDVNLSNVFALISVALTSFIPLLSVYIFPNITIGTLLLIPLAISLLLFVFYLFKR